MCVGMALLPGALLSLLWLAPVAAAAPAGQQEQKPAAEPWPVVRKEFAALLRAYDRIGVEREFSRGTNLNVFREPNFYKESLRPMEAVAELLAGLYRGMHGGSTWHYGKRNDYDQLLFEHFSSPCTILVNLARSKDRANIERVQDEMSAPKYDYLLRLCCDLMEPAQQERLFAMFKLELDTRFDLVEMRKVLAEELRKGVPLSQAVAEPQIYCV